ncbi:FAD-dependent oxidoreductase [Asanoa sp. WMMD1127]|uniref:FAD-dependent oxidoreductase n=1 Tax=Asanoa sp. WMMD1127 TaxID=3016107 RepID=UPI0024175F79|nr:FAD-dependent oxidoreductase [Asanoa sp. WMMD1127]MDG4820764.1 FAD-dependent oxidoreductase [Asanoa sp. WMMD1127]
MDYDEEVPVLIVGAGPVGLSTALFLARQGIRPTLVEKRSGTSVLPRAPGLQARTMELFRAAGAGADVRALEIGDSHEYFEGGILRVNTFAEIDDAVLLESPSLDGERISPERVMGCGQDRYETVLMARATDAGATLHFGTRLVDLHQDATGVTATVEDVESGDRRRFRARYLVGADGARSKVREVLGVPRSGRGNVFNAMSIYFRAPELDELLQGRKFILCYAMAGGVMVGLSRLHGQDPWLAAPLYHPEDGESPADFSDERCVEVVRTAAGRADLDVEIVAKVPWEGAQLVAERFRVGRVFLAGDAAHLHPPAGGFGANTGIHDAHNLAWKLTAALRGQGGEGLLDSYDAERRPLGAAMAEQAMVRNRIRHGIAKPDDHERMVDDIIITLGYRYRSTALTGADSPDVLVPRLELLGEPGTRAPHVWLDRAGERISTIDLFFGSWVLLTGVEGDAWAKAAAVVAERLPVPLQCYRIGPGGDLADPEQRWAQAYGVTGNGAVLVRPDAFVAWRSADEVAEPDVVLAEALARMADVPLR